LNQNPIFEMAYSCFSRNKSPVQFISSVLRIPMNLSEGDRKSVPKAFACCKTAVLSQAGFACPQQRKLPAVFEVLHCELMAEKPEIHVVNIGSDAAIVDLIQAETKRGGRKSNLPDFRLADSKH